MAAAVEYAGKIRFVMACSSRDLALVMLEKPIKSRCPPMSITPENGPSATITTRSIGSIAALFEITQSSMIPR